MTTVPFLLVERMISHLKKTVNKGVSSSSTSYVMEVKRGRFQDDFYQKFVYLTVNGGDPNNPDQRDRIARPDESDDAMYKIVPRETDGVEYWWRVGRVDLGCFFVAQGMDETTAAKTAHGIMARTFNAIRSCQVNDLRDAYGEHAIRLFAHSQTMFSSGGPPSQFIWKGAVIFQCLTERVPIE